MSTKLKNKVLLVCCVGFLLAGLAGAAIGKEQTSVLSRVQTVDDPELGELIRVALENLPQSKQLRALRPSRDYEKEKAALEAARLQTVRLVTEAYTQIKLLDSQIEQTNVKIRSVKGPTALTRELILARAELESKLGMKLAELREVMRIIPIHALGRRPVNHLNGWLKLDVISDSVGVFDCSKPFREYGYGSQVFMNLMSGREAFTYVKNFVQEREHLPVRIDIFRNVGGIKLSEELYKQVIDVVKSANLEMEAEVHLDEGIRPSPRDDYLYLEHDQRYRSITTVRRGNKLIRQLRNLIDPKDFDDYVRDLLILRPELLPLRLNISVYDEESKDLALGTAKAIEDAAKKVGVERFVEIVQEQVSPDETK